MDEPTAALGVSQTELVLSLITRLASRGIAVVVVSHNLNDVFRVADRIAVLYLGSWRPRARLRIYRIRCGDHDDRPVLP